MKKTSLVAFVIFLSVLPSLFAEQTDAIEAVAIREKNGSITLVIEEWEEWKNHLYGRLSHCMLWPETEPERPFHISSPRFSDSGRAQVETQTGDAAKAKLFLVMGVDSVLDSEFLIPAAGDERHLTHFQLREISLADARMTAKKIPVQVVEEGTMVPLQNCRILTLPPESTQPLNRLMALLDQLNGENVKRNTYTNQFGTAFAFRVLPGNYALRVMIFSKNSADVLLAQKLFTIGPDGKRTTFRFKASDFERK